MDIRFPPHMQHIQNTTTKSISKKNKETFSVDNSKQNAQQIKPTSTLNPITPLFFEEDPTNRKKRTIQKGKNILNELKKLHADLLAGSPSKETLDQLELFLTQKNELNVPDTLKNLLDEIETRAAVEIEKIKRKS